MIDGRNMSTYFESPFRGAFLSEQVTIPNIDVGKHSYYSGYYQRYPSEECVRYLSGEPGADCLIVGSF